MGPGQSPGKREGCDAVLWTPQRDATTEWGRGSQPRFQSPPRPAAPRMARACRLCAVAAASNPLSGLDLESQCFSCPSAG
eukprot:5897209-Lingulodinium_polyedra.AAC.1